jgi:hypothetical protein
MSSDFLYIGRSGDSWNVLKKQSAIIQKCLLMSSKYGDIRYFYGVERTEEMTS